MSIRWPWSGWVPPVLVDEGGIRHTFEGLHRYVPFVRIQNVTPYPRALSRDVLVVTTIDADYIDVSAPMGGDAAKLAHDILERSRMARATRAAAHARRGDLPTWVATVAASHAAHREGLAYRACSVDAEELDRIFTNPSEENEARAAAAHALLARGRQDRVAPRIGRLTPPLVVAAVRLANGGEAIVSDALLQEVLPFLELRDRVVFRQRSKAA